MEYELVMSVSQNPAETIQKFRGLMNEMIAKGWVPQGGVCVAPLPDINAYSISQAVIRTSAESANLNG